MEIYNYDYVEEECEPVVAPGFVRMMINKWTTLESKDDECRTSTSHNVRSNLREAKHSSRSAFRSCSPSRKIDRNFEDITNGNRQPFYILNGASINPLNVQRSGNKNQSVQSANNFKQVGGSNIIHNGANLSTSINSSNNFTHSATNHSHVKLPTSIKTNHLNLINRDLNGKATNYELNGFSSKSDKGVKENVLRDRVLVNHASLKLATTGNNQTVNNNRQLVNSFDLHPKKSNVKIYEDVGSSRSKNNLNSIHHNTPEPPILQSSVILDLLPESPVKIVDETFSEQKNGQYYLKIMKHTEIKLKSKCKEYEVLEGNVPEEVSGRIRSLIGNTQLLTNKKFTQFEKLCITNLENKKDEPSVTDEDLAGFWDLVLIQIQSIEYLFEGLDKLRDNDWIEVTTPTHASNSPKKLLNRSTSRPRNEITPPSKKYSDNLDKSDERKKLSEEKLRLREAIMHGRIQRKHSNNDDSEIQIFTK